MTDPDFDPPEAPAPITRPARKAPTVPASPDSEAHLLACCFLDAGATLDRAVAAGLTSTDFHDPHHARIWQALRKLRADNLPLDPGTATEHCSDLLSSVNPMLLVQLTDPGRYPTTAHAGRMIAEVADLSRRRALLRHATAVQEAISRGIPTDELPAEPTQRATGADLKGRPLGEFQLPDKGDPSILIGNRWLSRGDIFILASTSGMGKSSLTIQAARTWALGRPLFGGFHPHRPLRSLIVQAEDGDGDIAEVRLSLDFAEPLSAVERAQVNANVIIVTDRIHRGLSFRTELKRLIAIHTPDIVWINPLLAFIGGDVNDSTDVGTFLREQLNSLNEPAKFAYGLVHHTAKPPKEKSQRQWNEVMYEMAGSADLTNAARAVLALQATATPGEFNLIAAKRGGRTGLTRKVAQGAGFRDEPVSTISINHSKARMDVNGQSLPVIHWERGADKVEETPAVKSAHKAIEALSKFRSKIPHTHDTAMSIGVMHRALKDLTDLTYNGFKKVVIRAAEAGAMKVVERPGLGPCYYMPKTED